MASIKQSSQRHREELKRDIASDILGLRGSIQVLLNFTELQNTNPLALNKFFKTCGG